MGGASACFRNTRGGIVAKKKLLIEGKARADQTVFEPPFISPEVINSAFYESEESGLGDLGALAGWDVAVRFHEFARQWRGAKALRKLKGVSAEAVLARAKEVLGSVSSPAETRSVPLPDLAPDAEAVDVDLDETIENSSVPLNRISSLDSRDIWMSYREHRRQAIILCVDTSLSMTGEKLALTAVAIAVVLLQFPEDAIGVVAFENEAMVLKRPEEKMSARDLIERFLDVPAQGYTHLEDGLKSALSLVRAAESLSGVRASTVLLSDGKYTAGADPAYLAPRFPHLVVLKMGREKASLGLCRELARKGRGAVREIPELHALPVAMYGVVKDVLRGFAAR